MRIVEEEKKPSISVEELLDLLQTKKEKETRQAAKEKPFLKGILRSLLYRLKGKVLVSTVPFVFKNATKDDVVVLKDP